MPLSPMEERYKLMAYCDDVKPSVTCMNEFTIINTACTLFEKSSGCRLHRDTAAGKCKFLPLGRWKGTLQQEDIHLNYMLLSDSLDMVGVVLKAGWVQTRKANGDLIQDKVSKTINSWKSGKFMDLTSRPWSLNTYVLSKVWFKCHTVDLRVMDTSNITSKIKSWLFQDQLEKPQEMILHRPVHVGGLGLHHVKYKAQASLIRTFLETAVSPSFKHSLLHSTLYRIHVLGYNSLPINPTIPPYFPLSFFQTIRQVKENTPLNVATMSTGQRYRLLLEQDLTMVEAGDSRWEYIKSRIELSSPASDWETTWRRARLRGLGSEGSSFLWKLLHQLLPTEERLARILPNSSPNCKLCPLPTQADLAHCLFQCSSSRLMGTKLLTAVALHDPLVTPNKLLRLEFECENSLEMPLVWMPSQVLLYMWKIRCNKKIVDPTLTRKNPRK